MAVTVAVALVVVAALLRLPGLESRPGGLFQDEAAEGVDALRLLREPGFHPVFFADDGGREGLFAWMVAGAFRLLGPSIAVLRGTAAVLGVLAVVAIGVMLRRFGVLAALAGMAWATGSVWLVAVSRDGMRCILVPLVGALAMAALLRWERHGGRGAAVLAGAACGLGLWTYQPLKLLPVLVVLWLLVLRRVRPAVAVRLRRHLGAAVVTFLLVAAPMLAAAVLDPVAYFGRAASVTAGTASPEGPLLHVLRTIAMLGVAGDPNPRHDAASVAPLAWPLLPVAALGARRLWRRRSDPAHLLVLLAWPVFLLPPLVAMEGSSPHLLRALGLAPVLAATLGLGAVELWRLAQRWRPAVAAGTAGAAVAALVATSAQGWVAYASRSLTVTYPAYSGDLVALAGAASGPDTALVLDDYSALVVRFVDRDAVPALVAPGSRTVPAAARVVARSRGDLAALLGRQAAARAVPVAFDLDGVAIAWAVRR